ncbi:MAG: hypothetical protein GY710_22180 [Desulfobacteraceae bacterium]|nr:hypothetical protein [Desulfobacteraceae bacterium]
MKIAINQRSLFVEYTSKPGASIKVAGETRYINEKNGEKRPWPYPRKDSQPGPLIYSTADMKNQLNTLRNLNAEQVFY